jgi:hypothetical protein
MTKCKTNHIPDARTTFKVRIYNISTHHAALVEALDSQICPREASDSGRASSWGSSLLEYFGHNSAAAERAGLDPAGDAGEAFDVWDDAARGDPWHRFGEARKYYGPSTS